MLPIPGTTARGVWGSRARILRTVWYMDDRLQVLVLTDDARLERTTFGLLRSAGCEPARPADGETTARALERVRPIAVLVDCEHPAAVGDRLYEAAAALGAEVVVCARPAREMDAGVISRQQGVATLLLPLEREALTSAVRIARA